MKQAAKLFGVVFATSTLIMFALVAAYSVDARLVMLRDPTTLMTDPLLFLLFLLLPHLAPLAMNNSKEDTELARLTPQAPTQQPQGP